MPVGLLFLAAIEGYRATKRSNNKRHAKKYGYDTVLEHDHLWRPIDAGRRLSRNEARALAQHRRDARDARRAQQSWLEKGNTLPDYGQVQRAEGEERLRWRRDGSSEGHDAEERAAAEQQGPTRPTGATLPNAIRTDSSAAGSPEAELLRMSWSASPPYRANDIA